MARRTRRCGWRAGVGKDHHLLAVPNSHRAAPAPNEAHERSSCVERARDEVGSAGSQQWRASCNLDGMYARDVAEALRDDAREWAEGKSPWGRGMLFAYLAYAGLAHVWSGLGGEYRSWFGGITLAFHELGHVLFSGLGKTWMLLGGNVLQLVVPVAAGAYLLLRQHDWFGVAVCGSWLATSLFELATYVDDANRLQLPLVGMGDDVLHDWETLLTDAHLLNHAQTFARATQLAGIAVLAGSLALGGWLLLVMWRTRPVRRSMSL